MLQPDAKKLRKDTKKFHLFRNIAPLKYRAVAFERSKFEKKITFKVKIVQEEAETL
jgi:hypothetical protein